MLLLCGPGEVFGFEKVVQEECAGEGGYLVEKPGSDLGDVDVGLGGWMAVGLSGLRCMWEM